MRTELKCTICTPNARWLIRSDVKAERSVLTHDTESGFLKYPVHEVEVALVDGFGDPYVETAL